MDAAHTVEWVCTEHADVVDRLFDALDLNREELSEVRSAYEAGDRVLACEVLLDFYNKKAKTSGRLINPVTPGNGTHLEAEQILNDTFTFQNVMGTVPKQADGSLDWTHRGPNDDREWAYFLNRHGYLGTLLSAYQKTGNRSYVERIDAHIREWVLVNDYPGEQTGDPRWRGLETKSRISMWARIFYGLAEDAALKPATRILILSSIPDHAHYTQHFHHTGGNWLAMQMFALANGAIAWPEYKDADTWLNYATQTLMPEMERQIYLDGPQKELASHYHGASLSAFQSYADLFERSGHDVPVEWRDGLECMWNYWAYSMRPDGHGVLNNDSNLDYNRPRVLNAASQYDRPDWKYIASNGAEGERPDGLPSVIFPWAGQLISRSAWDADAHWSFFDIGPWGIGHQHNDKLHLSVSAYGRDILVDAGRLYYKRDKWRNFIQSTAAHNTLLIDGRVQQGDVKEVTEPLADNTYQITEAFDYARSSFEAGYIDLEGKATHTRSVMYVRDKYWIVVDRVETDRPRTIQALWHFHPECTVVANGSSVASTDANAGNVGITPTRDWDVEFIKGQEEPTIQGWYSREYNQKAPSTCAVYTTQIEGDATFAWVIVPGKGDVPGVRAELTEVKVDRMKMRVWVRDDDTLIELPLQGGKPKIQ